MIEQFKKDLVAKSAGHGGKFMKADFHLHIPGSSDYEYRDADALQQMAAALNDHEFRIAVALKHQEFPTAQEIEALQQLCPQTTLLPGAELNVFVDTLAKKVSKDHYFHCIVAANPDGRPDYLLHRAKEELTYRDTGGYPSGFHSSIPDLAKFFTDNGALFIPAHLHQSKSPDKSRSIDDIYDDDAFLGFVEAGLFTALEVREKATAPFFDGTRTTKAGKKIPRSVCIQSSDAHSHQHVRDRQRFTWVQMERPSFAELKAALTFPHRVRIDQPADSHSRVIGIHIVGHFIPDAWIAFNSAMNCLIGCKGSGKTAVLECLRFVLNTEIPSERHESVTKHVEHILGPSGFVECLIRRTDGTEALLIRRADSPSRITIVESDGDSSESDARQRLSFDAAILGWHEIEAVADHASARIRLVDRIQGDTIIHAHYALIDSAVETGRDTLPELQRKLKNLNESLQQLWTLQRKRQTLRKLEKASLIELQSQYEQYLGCEEELKTVRSQLFTGGEELRRSGLTTYKVNVVARADEELQKSVPETVKKTQIAASGQIAALQESLATALANVQGSEATTLVAIDNGIASIQAAFTKFRREEYEPKVNALPPDEREILGRQIQIIEETKVLPEVEARCSKLQSEVHSLAGHMYDLCNTICENRDTIRATRIANVEALNTELPTVRLAFQRSADHSRRHRFEKDYRDDAGNFFGLINRYAGDEPYEKLRTLFGELRRTDISEKSWTVDALLWDVKFVELLKVIDDDDVVVSMQVGAAGFVPIQNLSAGQRCTAVFPLLLRNTRGPLVIDQPEDNLDNRYIADTIAPDLLLKKKEQQFIATSHNANLVVLTDADLILHADSDGRTGELVQRGFFSCADSEISRSVIDVLDGGMDALLARQQKYGTIAK